MDITNGHARARPHRIGKVVIAAGLVLALGYWMVGAPESQSESGTDGKVDALDQPAVVDERANSDGNIPELRGDSIVNEGLPTQGVTTSPKDSLLSQRELSGSTEAILLAQPTPEEAAWMRSHGYPTYDQWVDRDQIDIELLERLAARGDLLGMAMLADRIRLTSPRRAEELLDQAILNGSTFAAALLSQHAAERVNAMPEEQQSRRRREVFIPFQLAAILGDNRASSTLVDLVGAKDMGTADLANANRQAFRRLDEINADRSRRGLPPLSIVARPGFKEWNERVWGKPPEKVEIEIDCNANPQMCGLDPNS